MIKFIKRTLLIILFLTAVGVLFRGWIYGHAVTYKSVGLRTNYLATDDRLVAYIELNGQTNELLTIHDVIKLGLKSTSRRLNFSSAQNDNDPNKLIVSKSAHCVGYAAFFATTCNHLLKINNLGDTWSVKSHVGELYVFGINIHPYINSAFFKDHDFVTIENKTSGEIFAVDPTVNDYLYIDFIRIKE